jgi:hypothetical protein
MSLMVLGAGSQLRASVDGMLLLACTSMAQAYAIWWSMQALSQPLSFTVLQCLGFR